VATATIAPPVPTGARRRFLPAGWALAALLTTYPLWWLLGLGGFSWTILAFPMGVWLLAQKGLRLPRGLPLYGVFLCFVFASVVRIDSPDRLAGYALRTSWYLAAGVVLLYLMNTEQRIPTRRILAAVVILWLATVVGGWLGLLFPHTEFESPMATALPERVVDNELVHSMVTPGFAEVQESFGVELPRPKAPFFYTNGWGSAIALLTPLVVGALTIPALRPSRRVVKVALALSLVPILMSLNRGCWVLLVLGGLYALARRPREGRSRATLFVVAGLIMAGTLVVATPLGDPIRAALDLRTADSNERRTILYEETIERTRESPFLGHGAPRPSEETAQSVGTHGQLWMVMFSHGFIAAGLYLAFFAVLVWRTRNPTTPLGMAAHVTLVIGMLEMFFYGQLPHQLFLVMVAAAIAYREARAPIGAQPS
jgi:O-antigen ligase